MRPRTPGGGGCAASRAAAGEGASRARTGRKRASRAGRERDPHSCAAGPGATARWTARHPPHERSRLSPGPRPARVPAPPRSRWPLRAVPGPQRARPTPNAGADRDAAEPAQPAQDSRGFGSAAQRASCARLESVRTRPERGASGWRTAAAELPPPASRGRARQAPELLISWLSRKLFTSAPTGAAGAA